jgi:hypothetical protein
MGQQFKDFQDLQCLATICQKRLTAPEFALMQAYLDKQAWVVKDLKLELSKVKEDHGKTYQSVQDVCETRDTLLKYVYRLLDRPNGVLLKDMHSAIERQLAAQDRLVATCKRLATRVYEKPQAAPASVLRTLERAEAQAKHDQKVIGELYGELSAVYLTLSRKR